MDGKRLGDKREVEVISPHTHTYTHLFYGVSKQALGDNTEMAYD